MRFDYLRSERSTFFRRVCAFRLPPRLHNAVAGFAGVACLICGAGSIEAYRLRQAHSVEHLYAARYARSQAAVQQANVYYARVRALARLDARVRQIAASGTANARTLAEVANVLPPHAWLTGISHDANGFTLEGRARSLSVLSAVIRRLSNARRLRNPALMSAGLENDRDRGALMKYSLHVDQTAP